MVETGHHAGTVDVVRTCRRMLLAQAVFGVVGLGLLGYAASAGPHRRGPFDTDPVIVWVAFVGPAACLLTSLPLLLIVRRVLRKPRLAMVALVVAVGQEFVIYGPLAALGVFGELHPITALAGLCTLLSTGLLLATTGLIALGLAAARSERPAISPARWRRRLLRGQVLLGAVAVLAIGVACLAAGTPDGMLWVAVVSMAMCLVSGVPLIPVIGSRRPHVRVFAIAVLVVPLWQETLAGVVVGALGAAGLASTLTGGGSGAARAAVLHSGMVVAGLCAVLAVGAALVNAGLLIIAPALARRLARRVQPAT